MIQAPNMSMESCEWRVLVQSCIHGFAIQRENFLIFRIRKILQKKFHDPFTSQRPHKHNLIICFFFVSSTVIRLSYKHTERRRQRQRQQERQIASDCDAPLMLGNGGGINFQGSGERHNIFQMGSDVPDDAAAVA